MVRLHQIRTNNVIQWESLEIAGLTIVFAFYGEIFSGIFQPLLYILGIYAHPLVRFLLGGVHFLAKINLHINKRFIMKLWKIR